MLSIWQIQLLDSKSGWKEFCLSKSSQKKQKLMEMAKNGETKPIPGKHPLGYVLNEYTRHNSSSYDSEFNKQIRERIPRWFMCAKKRKQQLLEMAYSGKPRPNKKSHKLGSGLTCYTSLKSGSYDQDFDKKIRKIRPDWFVSRSNISDQKKQQLLEMARNGEKKPKRDGLGNVLRIYTEHKRDCYDPEFDKVIRKIVPDWFSSLSDIADQKKQQLLEMARRGEPRPIQKVHELGHSLTLYTTKSNCYDLDFDKEIRKLRSDWFVSLSERANQKKKQLLEMARRGKLRPKISEHIGSCLSKYTTVGNTFDKNFDKEIRSLRPDWFRYAVNHKKKQLIDMARRGKPRPNRKSHKLASALVYYTKPKDSSYDPDFDKKIRELMPDWFRNKKTQSDIVDQKKQQLLEIARNGEPRPNQKTHKLGSVLGCYTRLKHKSYDPDFDKKIRKLRSDWFRKIK